MYRLKGADVVLRALRLVAARRDVTLHFAGGEPQPDFVREVRELARGLDVHFHGEYTDDLDQHPVARVHAFVSGTLAHESYGLVLDEAVALGLPMVLPRSGAYAERLEEGRGAVFYTQGDEESLAAALERIAGADALARVRAGLPELSRFVPSVEEGVRRHVEVYERAVEAGAPTDVRDVPERRMIWQATEDAWGRSLQGCDGEELGLS